MQPLTEHDLIPRGPLGRLGGAVFLLNEIDSTNQFLLERAADLPDGAVAWAEYQRAGRGRQGRSWVAPRASSILLSVLFHEPPDSPRVRHASHVACLAACEAVEDVTSCQPAIRWPNDLVLDGRKVAGALAESRDVSCGGAAGGRRALVLGIGINCYQHAAHFPAELREQATSLEIVSAQPVNRACLAARVLERLDHWFTCPNHDAWRSVWLRRCEDLGARVRLLQDGRTWAGTIVEVVEEGDLIVHLDDGTRRRFASATTTRIA